MLNRLNVYRCKRVARRWWKIEMFPHVSAKVRREIYETSWMD